MSQNGFKDRPYLTLTCNFVFHVIYTMPRMVHIYNGMALLWTSTGLNYLTWLFLWMLFTLIYCVFIIVSYVYWVVWAAVMGNWFLPSQLSIFLIRSIRGLQFKSKEKCQMLKWKLIRLCGLVVFISCYMLNFASMAGKLQMY